MGIWGMGLYENDTSLDVKDDFEKMFDSGHSLEEITNILIHNYSDLVGDLEEEPLFWLALADTQCDFGFLSPAVKERALFWIDNESSFAELEGLNEEQIKQRKKVLYDLRAKLLSERFVKKTRKKKRETTVSYKWEKGDIFAYRLESDLAKEKGLFGRYFLLCKIDETPDYGKNSPVVYVKITKDDSLPKNVEEYDELEYVQTWFSPWEERFWPIDARRPYEDIAEKSKLNYQVDEFGFLPEYRIQLINFTKKYTSDKLQYVNSFPNAAAPQNEFIPHSVYNIPLFSWKNKFTTFDKRIIDLYCGHNLRELSIYKKSDK